MLLFVLCAFATFATLALLVLPYLRAPAEKAVSSEYNLSIYKDQLAELQRDVDRGLIAPEEEEAARLEIERRMLQEGRAAERQRAAESNRQPVLLFSFVGAMPIVAGILYFAQGNPEMPAAPYAEREDLAIAPAAADGMHEGMGDRVSALRERLNENPDDAEGWALLARSLNQIGRYDEAIDAYREANRIVGGTDKRLAAEYAETLVVANDGMVGPEARMIFTAFIDEDPNDPQAVYYLGLAKAQEGNTRAAIADWQRLIDISPEGAPWLPVVERQIELARNGDTSAAITDMPASQPPAAPAAMPAAPSGSRGPTAADIAAAQQLTSEEQGAMIEGMVAGLAARLESDPDNLDGWRMLARSYTTLGRTEEARDAWENVLRLAPNDPDAEAALGIE